MDPTEGSETSANINQTLGIRPKIETVNTEHSESLKSRIYVLIFKKNVAHTPFISLQNAVYFIMLPFLVPVLLTFLHTGCAKI
jgi:hypothetical protein